MGLRGLWTVVALIAAAISAPARADITTYVGGGSGAFGTINLNTGAFTPIGPSFGFVPAGLVSYNGLLYATSYDANGTLYSVNPITGSLTSLGNSGIFYFGGIGATTSGIYRLDQSSNLYSINPANGKATLVGPTGAPVGPSWRDLSSGGSQLYFGNGPDLFLINTTTGAARLVGAFGGPSQIGAMVYENGILYGADQGRGLIVTINVVTGLATPIAGAVANNVWGLASLGSDPPASDGPLPPWALGALGAGLVGVAARRCRTVALR